MRLFAVLLFSIGLCAQPPAIVIRGARVVDGTGAPARLATVVIRGTMIEAVAPGAASPAGARVIDAAGQTLMPGLFDLHTHLSASAVTGLSGDWGKSLKAYLACGVTTVNDYATNGEMFAPLRQLLASGAVLGPRVNMAIRMSTPGGHGTEGGWGDFMTLTAATPEQAHARTRLALSYKPDVIKVFTDGWRYGMAPNLSSMNLETLSAIVGDAHAAGVKVFTHTVTLAGAKLAVTAGVDVLAHGIGDTDVDAELIALMKAKGTFYVPTLAVYEFKGGGAPTARALALLEPDARAGLLPGTSTVEASPERKLRWQHLRENVKRLHDAGIPVALGTDAGMPGTFHGYSTLRELQLLVLAGLTPLEAIAAGTSVSARALAVDGQRGTIAPGKLADLVLVEGRPDERIDDVFQTRKVFVGGSELSPADLEKAIQSTELTPLPLQRLARALIDDMERGDGRTRIDTLRVNSTDSGADHSAMLMLPVARAEGGHALLVAAQMAEKGHPYVRVEFPLTAGAINPADLSGYTGVSFDVRGEAKGRLLLQSYHVRGPDAYAAPFNPTEKWQTVRIPFTGLRRGAEKAGPWDGKDARALLFELGGAAGSNVWMELDNVRLY